MTENSAPQTEQTTVESQETITQPQASMPTFSIKTHNKKPPPLKSVSISDNVIGSAVAQSDEVTAIADDPSITNEEKVERLQDLITIKQARLKTLTQRAAQTKCLDTIELARQYVTLISADSGIETDDEEDMNIFDAISYNAKMVALKKSNAVIITGDAGVGKTHTVKEAISFLNPIKESMIVEEDDEIEVDDDGSQIEEQPEGKEGDVNFVIVNQQTETTETEHPAVEPVSEPVIAEPIVPASVIKVKKQPTKTHKVVKTLTESRNNVESGYYIASGTCTAAALYELLFIHRHKLLIFDDFDSVLKDDDCINLLKAALDTYPIRELSKMTKGNSFNSLGMTDQEMWDEYEITQKVPNQFKFSGNIIFISNIHEDKFDKALISRALHVEVRLTKKQMIERMHELMLDIRPEVDISWKLEALHHLEYLTSNYICKFDLNLRELIHFIDIRKSFPEETITLNGKKIELWKQLAKKRIVKAKLRR
jgi:hypothetical protein